MVKHLSIFLAVQLPWKLVLILDLLSRLAYEISLPCAKIISSELVELADVDLVYLPSLPFVKMVRMIPYTSMIQSLCSVETLASLGLIQEVKSSSNVIWPWLSSRNSFQKIIWALTQFQQQFSLTIFLTVLRTILQLTMLIKTNCFYLSEYHFTIQYLRMNWKNLLIC